VHKVKAQRCGEWFVKKHAYFTAPLCNGTWKQLIDICN